MGKALGDTEIRRFREDGFLSPVKFLEEDEALGYLARLEAFERDRPALAGKLDFKANLLLDWIDGLARREHILDIIEDLVGPDILNWNATFRFKVYRRMARSAACRRGSGRRLRPSPGL